MYRKDGVVKSKRNSYKNTRIAYEKIGYTVTAEVLYGYSFVFPNFKPKKVLTKEFFM